MAISAKEVKALRDVTGAGMMDCKKALTECDGDFEEAKLWLQKKGIAASQKRAGRSASEGIITVQSHDDGGYAVILELNCETDFVARNDDFQNFADELANFAVAHRAPSAAALLELDWDGGPVSERVMAVSGKTGEKILCGRYDLLEVPEGAHGKIGSYVHDGGKIGVALAATVSAAEDVDQDAFTELLKDLAMHIAASEPAVVSADALDEKEVAAKTAILTAQAEESGKPPQIVERMVQGRLNKWKKEVTLLSQPFVKDLDSTVEKHVAKVAKESLSGPVSVVRFVRFRLGEGAEA